MNAIAARMIAQYRTHMRAKFRTTRKFRIHAGFNAVDFSACMRRASIRRACKACIADRKRASKQGLHGVKKNLHKGAAEPLRKPFNKRNRANQGQVIRAAAGNADARSRPVARSAEVILVTRFARRTHPRRHRARRRNDNV
jgi:hypothetical protein